MRIPPTPKGRASRAAGRRGIRPLALHRVACGLAWLLAFSSPAQAQRPAEDPPVVTDVRFEGNVFFPDNALALRVRTRPNRRFVGVRGLTWWLWVYRLGSNLGGRFGRALQESGEPPAVLDAARLTADIERLERFYQQEGFREARIDAAIDTVKGGRRARVTFQIDPGVATHVRRVTYDGLEALPPTQRRTLAEASSLRAGVPPLQVDSAGRLFFRPVGARYSEPTLLTERRRLLAYLRDHGFAAATRDSIRALIFPQQADSFDVVFRLRPGRRYAFGDVSVAVGGPEPGVPARADTFALGEPGGQVTVRIVDESRLDARTLRRALQFEPGMLYSLSEVQATKRRLEATGLFALTDITAQFPQAALGDTARIPLPHQIELRTRPRHQMRVETFVLQRSGVIAASDGELGAGVGFTYENVNLLGGGEAFRIGTSGSVAAEANTRLFTSGQLEVTSSLTYPYLIAPLRWLDRRLGLYEARTRLSLGVLTARREDLGILLRGRGNARLRLEMRHKATVTSLIDLADISLSNPDTLPGFQERFLERILQAVVDPVQRAQIVEDYTQPQVNSALRYTFRSARVNPLRRQRGYSYEAAVEVGSNLPYLLDRFVLTPSTLEGSLPGIGGRRLIYRQYARATVDLRRYRPLSEGTVLATKFIGGLAQPTGQADIVPFDRRFYSGGATSVRGWRLRELGPGSAAFGGASAGDEANILGGDIKLEGGVELRQSLLRGVLAAEWIGVLFADAGNVWFGPRNPGASAGRFRFDSFFTELGVGTGVGLRLAWEYLIVRLDAAVRAYDPVQSRAGLFPDGLSEPLVHFGIGHAF